MSLGDVQAFIQYSRQFTQPLALGLDGQCIPVGGCLRGASVSFSTHLEEAESAIVQATLSPSGVASSSKTSASPMWKVDQ